MKTNSSVSLEMNDLGVPPKAKAGRTDGRPLARPLLKWAGGKGQLLAQFEQLYPQALKDGLIDTYIEPFLGGAAVFLSMAQRYTFRRFVVSDVNLDLVLLYRVVKECPADLIGRLAEKQEAYMEADEKGRERLYYAIRDSLNHRTSLSLPAVHACRADHVDRVAETIFLNRTCFNGLYRLNSKGAFNVPFGKYANPRIVDADNIHAVSSVLQRAEIHGGDFDLAEQRLSAESAFVYFDPPYRPLSATSQFTSYAGHQFGDPEQERLAKLFHRLAARPNTYVMLSNSDPQAINPDDDFFERIYQGANICRVRAARNINAKGSRRGHINELVITNY